VGRYILAIGLLLAAVAIGLATLQRRMHPAVPATAANQAARVPGVPAIRGKAAPDFELTDVQGSKIRAADFKNKVLLVNFWATWCSPCIVEIPWFVEFQQKYGSQGLQVIGISLDESGVKDVKPFVEKHKMTYPILLGNDKTAEQFGGIIGLPTTFIVDRDGKFYTMHRGLVSHEDIEEELKSLLGKGSQSTPAASAQPTNNAPVSAAGTKG
jgi:peroxiredoxin